MPRSAGLNSTITALASDFARSVAAAIRGSSLGELTNFVGGSPHPGRAGKKIRTVRVNWPKCPVCGKNAFPRGKGYCYEHFKTTGKKRKAASKSRPKTAKLKKARPQAQATEKKATTAE